MVLNTYKSDLRLYLTRYEGIRPIRSQKILWHFVFCVVNLRIFLIKSFDYEQVMCKVLLDSGNQHRAFLLPPTAWNLENRVSLLKVAKSFGKHSSKMSWIALNFAGKEVTIRLTLKCNVFVSRKLDYIKSIELLSK